MSSFKIMLDVIGYGMKPKGYDIAAITRRLQHSKPIESTAGEFCEHVKRGCTWMGGCYEPTGESGWGKFVGQQIIGLDFDNSSAGRPLHEGDPGFLDSVDALIRCEELGLEPMCLYFTMSAVCPDLQKYRLCFDMGEMLDEEKAKACINALLNIFPEADQACRNPNRLFFGSQGEVWPCWESFGGA